MPICEIMKGIYSVGVVDWNIRWFHGPTFSTHQGTSYNAYLIMDDKVTLVDTVEARFTGDFIQNIAAVVDPSSIDVVIVNHIEPDHSGAFPEVMRLNPNAKVYSTSSGAAGLKKHYNGDWDIKAIKTGDSVKIGRRTLQFIETPMLHWPDNMITYIPEDKLLLSNDAFGQHYASNKPFDDQVDQHQLMDAAAKYFANILTPFSKLVLKKLAEIEQLNLQIDMIAPAHGIIWRSGVKDILTAYGKWARGEAKQRVIIAYETMWESTARLAHAMLDGISEEGVEARLYQISKTDYNDLITEIMDSQALLIGSSTINNSFIPTVAPLLDELVGLKLGGKLSLAFGSQGWAGGAVKEIESYLSKAGMELMESFTIKWGPNAEELEKAREIGRTVGQRVKG